MRLLVFGQGKTGTTVIAKTIQHSLSGAAFRMEPKPGETLGRHDGRDEVVKILHGQWKSNLAELRRVLRNETATKFDRRVWVIRDPRDQAISVLLYNFYGLARNENVSDAQLQELLKIVRAKERAPATLSFTALCAEINRVLGWNGYTSTWLMQESGLIANPAYGEFLHSLGEGGHLLRYEDFVSGNLTELESYLGFRLSSSREVGEFSRTRRSAAAGNWREFFTAEDVALLRPALEASLAEMGYRDWELRPVARLNPDHFSGYLVRLIAEARARLEVTG